MFSEVQSLSRLGESLPTSPQGALLSPLDFWYLVAHAILVLRQQEVSKWFLPTHAGLPCLEPALLLGSRLKLGCRLKDLLSNKGSISITAH